MQSSSLIHMLLMVLTVVWSAITVIGLSGMMVSGPWKKKWAKPTFGIALISIELFLLSQLFTLPSFVGRALTWPWLSGVSTTVIIISIIVVASLITIFFFSRKGAKPSLVAKLIVFAGWMALHGVIWLAFPRLVRSIVHEHLGLFVAFEIAILIIIVIGGKQFEGIKGAKAVKSTSMVMAVVLFFALIISLIFSPTPGTSVAKATIAEIDAKTQKVEEFVDTVFASMPDWMQSKVVLQPGDEVVITAIGTIVWDPQVNTYGNGPQGLTRDADELMRSEDFPEPGAPIASLLCKATYELVKEEVFFVGKAQTYKAKKNTELYWGVNDRGLGRPELSYCFADNSGMFIVTSKVIRH